MNKRVRILCFLLAGVLVAPAGCKRKPAYSDIDANRSARSQNQNAEAGAAQPAGAESPAPPVSQPPPAPTETSKFKSPSFIDQAKGEIKDLPNYPGGYRTDARIGPVGEANVASFALQTRDAMDKIAAFYERAIKNNRWKVIEKTIDPDICKWTMVKGQDDSAKVEAKKDSQTGIITILVVRGEKLDPAK